MKPFDRDSECIKCGSHDTKFKYFGSRLSEETKEDFIVVTCNICGYEWKMATKEKGEGRNNKEYGRKNG